MWSKDLRVQLPSCLNDIRPFTLSRHEKSLILFMLCAKMFFTSVYERFPVFTFLLLFPAISFLGLHEIYEQAASLGR